MSSSSRKIEMTWKCSACGHENLGRHKVCQSCGDPKDAAEKYEMPSNTAAAPSVTDPALLRLANAGPNWQCRYCKSHQRRLDGLCAQCGASQDEGVGLGRAEPRPPPSHVVAQAYPAARPTRKRAAPFLIAIAGAFAVFLGLGCVAMAMLARSGRPASNADYAVYQLPAPPPDVEARVDSVYWRHAVLVERYRLVQREGFEPPAQALEIRSLGRRHHHDEQVFDHNDTEHYTERVQDGFDTEHYTERVSCGQDCTPGPERCSESCTPDENGFATCTTTCTPGAPSCSPRYCDEPRTRQVPRYRDVPRTREIPRYRTERRDAEYFAYKLWEWGHHRVLDAIGTDTTTRWPSDDEIRLNETLAEGERERAQRTTEYRVMLLDVSGERREHFPRTEPEFARFTIGRRFILHFPFPGGAFRIRDAAPIADAGP